MPRIGQGIAKGLGITLRHLFEKKVTRQYPEYRRELPERTRGMLTVDMDRYIACLQCMRICPDHCISIEQTKRDRGGSSKPEPHAVGFAIDDSRCMYCAPCVEVCPANCIYHTEEFEMQAYNRLELARQFGERPVDPHPTVKKEKRAVAKKVPSRRAPATEASRKEEAA